jgi:hypothetical protein
VDHETERAVASDWVDAGCLALTDALEQIGLSPADLIEAVAAALQVAPATLLDPRDDAIATAHPQRLAMLLPRLMCHSHPDIAQLGARWLACEPTLYHVPRSALAAWLQFEPRLASAVAPRLEREGLALLGTRGANRLVHTAQPDARAALTQACSRILQSLD